MNHSRPALNALSAIHTHPGGQAVVLVGGDPPRGGSARAARYYAGMHRPPADNALEAALTFLSDPGKYKEVRVFCGVSPLLPRWSLPLGSKEMMLGCDDAMVFRLFGPPPAAPAAAEKPAASLQDRLNNRQRRPPPEGAQALSKPGDFNTLGQRLEHLLQVIEAEAQSPLLLVVDESWLMHRAQAADRVFRSVEEIARLVPEHDKDLAPNGAAAERLSRRFAAIPAKCRTGQLTVALLHSRARAAAFRAGHFHSVRMAQFDPQGQPTGDIEPHDLPNTVELIWEPGSADFIELPTEMDQERPYGVRVVTPAGGEVASPVKTHSAYTLVADYRLAPEPDPLEELREMVGMKNIHGELSRWMRKLREDAEESRRRNRRIAPRNFTLLGNPGTGKSTLAHILARCLRNIGAVSSDVFIKAGRGDLIGQYQGQTVAMTTQVLDSALGGVLFIDEAHAIATEIDYGKQCAKTLLPYTDGTRDLCVIVAGYQKEMQDFFKLDPGLPSRFPPPTFTLPDYSAADLLTIVGSYAAREWGAALAPEAGAVFCARIDEEKERARRAEEPFGNARYAIDLIKNADMWRSDRVAGQSPGAKIITAEDIANALHTEPA